MKCARGDGNEATHHIFWNEWRDGALVCDDHTQQAYRYPLYDVHSITDVCVNECPIKPAETEQSAATGEGGAGNDSGNRNISSEGSASRRTGDVHRPDSTTA